MKHVNSKDEIIISDFTIDMMINQFNLVKVDQINNFIIYKNHEASIIKKVYPLSMYNVLCDIQNTIVKKLINDAHRIIAIEKLDDCIITLEHYIKDTRFDKLLISNDLDYYDFITIAKSLSKTIYEFSKSNIILRDIKPSNIIIHSKVLASIIDFDYACYKDDKMDAVGTIGYASVEHFSGKTSEQSDLYSLGITLLQLLNSIESDDYNEDNKLINRLNKLLLNITSINIKDRIDIDDFISLLEDLAYDYTYDDYSDFDYNFEKTLDNIDIIKM